MIFQPIIDTKHQHYCGPTSVALLTGVPLSRIEHMFRRGRKGGFRNAAGKRKPIRSTYRWEVVKVLKRLGCKVKTINVGHTTFHKFVDDIRHAGTFLVNVTGHFMVCSNGLVADTTHKTPIPVENYNKGRRRVEQAWKVIAPALPKYTVNDLLVAQRAPKPKKDVKVVRAEKAAKDIKRWERKAKLAKTKLKKLRSQLKRYQKLGIVETGA